MARGNSTLPICFFKIILQTNLQTIKIPNKFTRSHGVGLPNPMFIKPPDGTKWKVFWKNINGEIWFQKGWKIFTQNYSLQHGCLVVFKYKEGSSELDVIILGQHAVEIDYDSSRDTSNDEDENLDHRDDEPVETLNVDDSDDESIEILNEWHKEKKPRQKSPLASPRPHKKVRGDIEKNSQRSTSLNKPKEYRAREVAEEFISNNPFFIISIKPANLVANVLIVPNLKGAIENENTNVMVQIGERSWNLKLLRSYSDRDKRRFSAGWSMFAKESGLQPGDVCVFELMNKEDLVFKVHVFKRTVNVSLSV
ncbi:B3 domain-containing transcription factor VRN1-like [Vicia villosa]|uniref:B3 domain-containing transcription factor VRN1-like n=1 Tax=Vicia villosa TaxID=3911 RepID=UPI00273BBB36|nr:B3 domain-containing transcription factor VRN1-like [Vicia villosa]XP_058783962.1 B3 domain-containing transcription factor VRN1-like [Vicia villosa]